MNNTFDMDSWEVKNGQSILEKKRAALHKPARISAPLPPHVSDDLTPEQALQASRDRFKARYINFKNKVRSRENNYDAPAPEFGKRVEVKNGFTCPDCKMQVNQIDTHGYKRIVSSHNLLATYEACKTCTPPVRRALQRENKRVQMERLVTSGSFANINNFPDGTEHWTFKSYVSKFGSNRDIALYLRKNFVSQQDKNIFLHGSTGVGKTGVAIAAAREMAAAGLTVIFIRSSDYVDMCESDRKAMRSNNQTDVYNIEKICKQVEVLVLDELGTGPAWEARELESIIEYRWNNGLATLITSNYSIEGLAAYYQSEDKKKTGFNSGDRIISRLSRYASREVKGTDQRKNQ